LGADVRVPRCHAHADGAEVAIASILTGEDLRPEATTAGLRVSPAACRARSRSKGRPATWAYGRQPLRTMRVSWVRERMPSLR
jgi:hypothetical protein